MTAAVMRCRWVAGVGTWVAGEVAGSDTAAATELVAPVEAAATATRFVVNTATATHCVPASLFAGRKMVGSVLSI